MSSSSCSHWWHAPVYLAAAVAIVIAAASPSLSSTPPSPSDQEIPPGHMAELSPDARLRRLALHRSGFNMTAAILQISAGLILPADGPATLFAAPDPAVSNLSLSAAERLLRYHTVPLRLTAADLLRMPPGTCLPTLLLKNLAITASNSSHRSVSVNGVPISHPDIFVSGSHAIHGAAGALLGLSDGIPDPVCESTAAASPASVPWARLVQVLGARGFVSFSVGLSTVLDAVKRDAAALDHVTVFAPVDGGFDLGASPGPMLERAVKHHVAVGRLGYKGLSAMRVGEEIRTLARDGNLRITSGGDTGAVAINGVEITQPEMYMTEGVAVHGIPEAFEM